MKISRREMVIGIITLFIVLFGLTYWLGGSKIAENREIREDKARSLHAMKVDKRILAEKEVWMEQLTELQKQLPVYDKKVNLSGDIRTQIKRLGDKNSLDFTQTRTSTEKQIGTLYELNVTCNWEGELDALVHFLYEINEQGLQFDIRELSVRPDAKRVGILRGDMTIACAYRRADGPQDEN